MLMLVVMVACPACPARGPGDDTAKVRRRPPLTGAVIRVRIPADLPQLPCLLRNHTWCDRMLVHTVYEPLVRYDVRKGKFTGVLATGWKYLDEGRTFQLELRKKVKWHNGKAVTTKDVKHTLNLLQTGSVYQGHPASRLLRKHVERYSYPTDHLFEIRFKKPFGPILELLAALPIMPAPKTLGKPETNRERIVGTGPYRFLQWWPAEKIVFSRFADYWGQPGRAYRLEFHVIPSVAQARKKLLAAKLDLIFDVSTIQYKRALNADGAKLRPFSIEPAQFAYLALNTQRGPFMDPRVRRAVGLLLDRSKLLGAMPGRRPRTLEQPVWILGPQARASKGTGMTRAPAEAKGLLEKAGWRRTGRYWKKNGKRLEFTVVTANRFTAFNRGLKATRSDFEDAGIKLQVAKVLWGELVVSLKKKRFDAIALSTPLYGPWSDLTDLFHSRSISGGGNHAGWRNATMDKLLEKMMGQVKQTQRMAAERRIFQFLAKEAPIIPLYAPRNIGLARKNLSNIVPTPLWLDLSQLVLK
jgi:peptide/nickel transport system substrate-binding protein